MDIFFGYLYTYAYVFFIILVSNIFKKEESSRKFIHIFVAFAWFIMNHYFKTSIHMIIPPISFIIINYISYKKNIFKTMERKKDNTLGTVYYAVSMSIMAIITYFYNDFLTCYALGLFIMALGDGLAPIVAKAFKSNVIYNNKTLAGSITIFVVCTILFVLTIKTTNYFYLVLCALFCTFIELYSKKGIDNILLPLASSFLVYILFF